MKQSAFSTSPRLIGIDIVKILAMFGVLFLHTLLAFTKRPDFIHTKIWWLLEPLAVVSSLAVPLFFLTSGYLTLTKQVGIRSNLRSTIIRLGIPLLVFTLIKTVYVFLLRNPFREAFAEVLVDSILNIMSSQLWFLVYLLVFKLLQPFFQLLFQKEHKQLIYYVMGVLVTLFFFASFSSNIGTQGTIYSLLGGLVYYFIGGMLRLRMLPNISLSKYLLISVIAFVYLFVLDILTLRFGYSNALLNSIGVMLGVLAVPAIFSLCLSLKTLPFSKILGWLATMSFGVYLWREQVVMFRTDVLGFEYDFVGLNPYLYSVANFTLVLGMSLLLTWFVSCLPKMKVIVGFK